jgi:hypothetical protein
MKRVVELVELEADEIIHCCLDHTTQYRPNRSYLYGLTANADKAIS